MTLLTGGTVRPQFDDNTEGRRIDLQRQFLAAAIDELQVPGHYLGLVERLLELIPDADSVSRTSARLVGTALISGIARGSTGLPLSGELRGIGVRSELQVILETARRLAREASEDDQEIPADLFEGLDAESIVETFGDLRTRDTVSGKLIGEGTDYTPLVVDHEVLYTHKTAAMERRVTDRLVSLLESDSVVDRDRADEVIDTVLARMPFEMNDTERTEKRNALHKVLSSRLSVITGGAGSGKTTMVLLVLRVLNRMAAGAGGLTPEQIALAAPTGKAAKRLGRSIEKQFEALDGEHVGALAENLEEPMTLHRLLKYSPYFKKFRRDADNPIDATLVVVDEASMIGLEMMQALVEALPRDGRLLLVGDAGQLPSVQAGAVFHDLSEGDTTDALNQHVCVLDKNYRVSDHEDAANIVEVSKRIREGETDLESLADTGLLDTIDRFSSDTATVPGVHFCSLDDEDDEALSDLVEAWADAHFSELWPVGESSEEDDAEQKDDRNDSNQNEKDEENATWWYREQTRFDHREDGGFTEEARRGIEKLFDTVSNCQLLTITRVGEFGSRALNRRLHRRYRATHDLAYPLRTTFEAGEPVMITRNDYDEDVFNGEQGVVLFTRRRKEDGSFEKAKKRVVVPDGKDSDGDRTFRAVSFQRLKDKLVHAYALTVHKSQGSEYDHVGVVLPPPVDAPDSPEQKTVHPLMTRQILYTAITRAKTSATIIGNSSVFNESITRSAGRYSGVARRLDAAVSDGSAVDSQ